MQVLFKSHNNNEYFAQDHYIFMILSRSVIFKMRNVSEKHCREKQNT